MPVLNRVQLIGHLGRDPETRSLSNGDPVASLNIATTETWRDKASGEKREATEWHRAVIYGKLADVAGQYLRKGALVYVEGKLRTRKYTDKDSVERYVTEINVDTMQMLDRAPGDRAATGTTGGSRPRNDTRAPGTRSQPPASQTGGMPDYDDDMIPFAPLGARAAWSTI